ncbi:MAG: GNAT family N-acetyltransferase [Holosporales bacterium]|nr:GNAT family N-acetyltransferase [Holosporales bacterium]
MFHVEHFANHKFSNQSIKAFLSLDHYKTFGALTNDSQLIGYIVFTLAVDEADIVFLGIHTQFRRQGLGSKLLNVPCGTFSISKTSLEVSAQNVAAINMYRKNGFKVTSIRRGYFSNETDALNMIRYY